eukprot:10190110-Alexandrium_andersonii.AAC.1
MFGSRRVRDDPDRRPAGFLTACRGGEGWTCRHGAKLRGSSPRNDLKDGAQDFVRHQGLRPMPILSMNGLGTEAVVTGTACDQRFSVSTPA